MSKGWNVPRMWEDGEVWILGGGPSLAEQFAIPEDVQQKVYDKEAPLSAFSPYLSTIHDKHVIGINVAFQFGEWVDIVFFGDHKFYLYQQADLTRYKGIKVSSHHRFEGREYEGMNVRYMPLDNKKTYGISNRPGCVCWNQNSGAAAISLAVHLGAKRIILVGFDMTLGIDGKKHFHTVYSRRQKGERIPDNSRIKMPFGRHLKGFPAIAADAYKMGIEIINASPKSTIDVFPKRKVEDLL